MLVVVVVVSVGVIMVILWLLFSLLSPLFFKALELSPMVFFPRSSPCNWVVPPRKAGAPTSQKAPGGYPNLVMTWWFMALGLTASFPFSDCVQFW